MSGLLATLEENRLWITLGFGAIAVVILIVYGIRNRVKNASRKKSDAKANKRKAAAVAGSAAVAPTGVDSNGMPLDGDDDGEFRDGFNEDMDDGEAVYKDWD